MPEIMKYSLFILFMCAIDVVTMKTSSKNAHRCRRLRDKTFVWETTGKAGMCIFWSKTWVTFAEAERICQEKKSRLAVPKHPYLFEIFTENHKKFNFGRWIGLDDIKTEGTFIWHDGTILEKKDYGKFWRTGEPNNVGGREDCAYHSNHSNTGSLNDALCTGQLHFACEKDVLTKIY